MNSEWIPAGILPESTESSHSCEIPAEFRRNSWIPAGISGGLKSSAALAEAQQPINGLLATADHLIQ